MSTSLRDIVKPFDDAVGRVNAVGDDTGVVSLGIRSDLTPSIFCEPFEPGLFFVSSWSFLACMSRQGD